MFFFRHMSRWCSHPMILSASTVHFYVCPCPELISRFPHFERMNRICIYSVYTVLCTVHTVIWCRMISTTATTVSRHFEQYYMRVFHVYISIANDLFINDSTSPEHHTISALFYDYVFFPSGLFSIFFFPLTNELQASYSSSGKNDEEYFEGNKNVCHRNQQQTIQIFVQTFNVIYNHQCLFIRCGFMNSKFMRFFFLTCGLWPRIYASALCLIDVWEYWEFSGSGMALFIGITFYCTATVWCYCCCCFFFSSNV